MVSEGVCPAEPMIDEDLKQSAFHDMCDHNKQMHSYIIYTYIYRVL